MPAFTTRLGLYKPGGGSTGLITPDEVVDVDKINGNLDVLDAFIGAPPVTSGTRPASPKGGQTVIETDTGNVIVWDAANSYWRPAGTPYCANAGVRDAFFPNPKQGDMCYRADLGRVDQYYALYDPSTNKNGWVKAGWHPRLSPGWTLIQPDSVAGTGVTIAPDGSIVLAAAASMSANSAFWGLFTEYMIELNLNTLSGTGASAILLKLRAAGTDLVSNSYNWSMLFANSSTPGAANLFSTTSWQLAASLAVTDMVSTIRLDSPAETKRTVFRAHSSAESASVAMVNDTAGINTSPLAYDGLTLTASTGTMTGTAKIFGLFRGGA